MKKNNVVDVQEKCLGDGMTDALGHTLKMDGLVTSQLVQMCMECVFGYVKDLA